MRASDNLTAALKNIEQMGNTLSLLKSSFTELSESAFKSIKSEDRETFQQFVKESNELIGKSSKLSLSEIDSLTNALKLKYGFGTNHK